MDNFDEATRYFNRALEICQNIFGEKNMKTAETYRHFADLLNK